MKLQPAFLAVALVTLAAGPSDRGAYEASGRIVADGSPAARGGPFAVDGAVVAPTVPRGGVFVLRSGSRPGGSAGRDAAGGCFCRGLLFADGFETGTTAAWGGS